MPSQFEKRTAKKKETKEAVVENTQPNYTKESYDIFLDEATKQYVKVVVAYDPVSGMAKVSSIEPIADNQMVANYKIKEIFAKKIMNVK